MTTYAPSNDAGSLFAIEWRRASALRFKLSQMSSFQPLSPV